MVYIRLRKELSSAQIPAANRKKLRSHAAEGGCPILLAVDDLETAVHIRRQTLNQRNLRGDRLRITEHQRSRATSTIANSITTTASCFHPNKVIAEAFQLVFDGAGSSIPDCYHANKGGDTNCNP